MFEQDFQVGKVSLREVCFKGLPGNSAKTRVNLGELAHNSSGTDQQFNININDISAWRGYEELFHPPNSPLCSQAAEMHCMEEEGADGERNNETSKQTGLFPKQKSTASGITASRQDLVSLRTHKPVEEFELAHLPDR